MYFHTKTCVFCDKPIRGYRQTCKEHSEYFLTVQNEDWLKYLLSTQQRQSSINSREMFSLFSPSTEDAVMVANSKEFRNQLIFSEYAFLKRKIKDIAPKYGLTERSIKAIIKKVKLSGNSSSCQLVQTRKHSKMA